MNQQSSIQRVNGMYAGILWLVFTILITVDTVIRIFFQFNPFNIASYVISVLVCIAAWLLWVGARKGRVQRTGLTLISGVLITKIVLLCIAAVFCAVVGIILALNDAAGIGLGILVGTAIWFVLAFLYYRELRRVATAIRDIIDTGFGNVRVSMYVIVVMCISAACTILGTISMMQAGRYISTAMDYIWMMDEEVYRIADSVLSNIGIGGKAVFISLIGCSVQVMAIILLCMMRNGLPEASADIQNDLITNAYQRLRQKTCPQCGSAVPANAVFCSRCGKEMPAPESVPAANRQTGYPEDNWQRPTVSPSSPADTSILREKKLTPAETSLLGNSGSIAGTRGSLNGKLFQLPNAQAVAIGRDSAQCQILIAENNISISRKHCTVEFRADMDAYCLIDYSSNGVFVGGVQIPKGQPQMLGHGTEVQLGDRQEAFVLK